MENQTSEELHADWCNLQWLSVKMGGLWIVPRSGLILTKTPEGFNLTGIEKIFEGKRFADYQRSDFDCIKSHFAAADLKVTDSGNLLGGAK